MVWAPIWVPKPSRRPSRRHPKKTLNFDTYFLLIFGCFAPSPEAPKIAAKNGFDAACGGPILAPKAPCEENGAPGCFFEAFWLPKSAFWQRFLSVFCIYLGSRNSNNIRHKLPNNALAELALQSCNCQIRIPNVHLQHIRPKHALAKYASQHSSTSRSPGT